MSIPKEVYIKVKVLDYGYVKYSGTVVSNGNVVEFNPSDIQATDKLAIAVEALEKIAKHGDVLLDASGCYQRVKIIAKQSLDRLAEESVKCDCNNGFISVKRVVGRKAVSETIRCNKCNGSGKTA